MTCGMQYVAQSVNWLAQNWVDKRGKEGLSSVECTLDAHISDSQRSVYVMIDLGG
jgi:hypothetical protein